MFKTTISAYTIEGPVAQAAASPSLNRIAITRSEEPSGGGPAASLGPVVELYDSTALVAPLDRSARVTGAEALGSMSPSPSGHHQASPAPASSSKKIASVVLFPDKDCHARRWRQRVVALAWLDDSVLAVLCRNERGSSTSLTIVALVEQQRQDAKAAEEEEGSSDAATWAIPEWSRLIDGTVRVLTLASPILRQYILCGRKDALIELTLADSIAPEPAEGTEMGLSLESVEQYIVDGIWQIAEDGIRDALWIQLDQVLASVKFQYVGRGMLMYHVLHRIPLNNNILTLEHGLKPLKWASAMRVVFVYDEEFGEVKVWSLQVSTAICITNIPVHGVAVDQIFCSNDASILFTASREKGLRLFSTESSFRAFSTSHSKAKRRPDMLRTCVGSPLEQELSALVPWSGVDRSSKNKMRLFRETPHMFPAAIVRSKSRIERCAVVENNICVLMSSGEAAVFTPTGDVLSEANILALGDAANQKAVLLRARRPPLPNHVLHLVMTSFGIVAHFATDRLGKDELLRNEIKFDFLSTALLLCELNGWNPADIQEKTLNIAIADSPEAVFNVIHETFSIERDAAAVAVADSALDDASGPQRPLATLQLIVRLCNAICSRFDNCPDDLQARQTLRSLVGVTISACSLVETYCASLIPKAAASKLLDLIEASEPIEKPFVCYMPAAASYPGEDATNNTDSERVKVDEATLLKDVHLLMSLVAGLRSAQASIPQGTIIIVTSGSLDWSPQRTRFASYPPRDSLLGGGAHPQQQQGGDKGDSGGVDNAAAASAFRNDWQKVCFMVLDTIRQDSIGAACGFLNSNLPLLSDEVRRKLDEFCFPEAGAKYFSEVTTPAKAPSKRPADLISSNTFVARLTHVQLLVSRLVLAQLQRALSQTADDSSSSSCNTSDATSKPRLASSSRSFEGLSSVLPADATFGIAPAACLQVLAKAFSRRHARRWWATARRMTISPAMRGLLDDVMAAAEVAPKNTTTGGGSKSASESAPVEDEEESLILLLDVIHSVVLCNFSQHSASSSASQKKEASKKDSTNTTSQFAGTFALRAGYSHGRFLNRSSSNSSTAGQLTTFRVPPQNDDDDADISPARRASASVFAKYHRTVDVADLDEQLGVVAIKDIAEAASSMVLKPAAPPCYCPMAVSWMGDGADTATQAQQLAPALFETLVFQRRDVKSVDGATAALRVLTGEAPMRGTPLAFLASTRWFTTDFHAAMVKGALTYCVSRLDAEAAAWLAINSSAVSINARVSESLAELLGGGSHHLETNITLKLKLYVLECALAASSSSFFSASSSSSSSPVPTSPARAGRFAVLLESIPALLKTHPHLPVGFSIEATQSGLLAALQTPALRGQAVAALVSLSTDGLVPVSRHFIISLLDQADAWGALAGASLAALGDDDDVTMHYAFKRVEIKTSQQLAQAIIAAAASSPAKTGDVDLTPAAIGHFMASATNTPACAGFEGVMVAALAGIKWSALPPQPTTAMLNALLSLDADYRSLCVGIAAQLGAATLQAILAVSSAAKQPQLQQASCRGAAPSRTAAAGAAAAPADDHIGPAQRQQLIDMACRLNAGSTNARLMDILSDPNKGLRLSRGEGPAAVVTLIPTADVARDFFSTEAVAASRAAASIAQWVCVESIVKNAERPEDVVIGPWELLADGRPISAFHAQSLLVNDARDVVIRSAREIAISRANDGRHVAVYAAFLFLLDPLEFARLLLDVAVVQRLLKFTKGPQGKASLQSIKLIPGLQLPTSADAATRPDSRSIALIANTLQQVTELLAESATSELDEDGVPPSILVARFVMMYGSRDNAKAVIGSSVADQLKKNDWVHALYILWATQSSSLHVNTSDFKCQLPLLNTLQNLHFCPSDELLTAQRISAMQTENVRFVKSYLSINHTATPISTTDPGQAVLHVICNTTTKTAPPRHADDVLLAAVSSATAAVSRDENVLRGIKSLVALQPSSLQFALELVMLLVTSASVSDIAVAQEQFEAAAGTSKTTTPAGASGADGHHFAASASVCLQFHLLLAAKMYRAAAELAAGAPAWPSSELSSGWSAVVRRTLERLMVLPSGDTAAAAAAHTSLASKSLTAASLPSPLVPAPSEDALTLYRLPLPNLCHVVSRWIEAALRVLFGTNKLSTTASAASPANVQAQVASTEGSPTQLREIAAHMLCSTYVLQAFVSGRPFSDAQIKAGIVAAAPSTASLVLTKEAVDEFHRVQIQGGAHAVLAKTERYFTEALAQSGTLFACKVERAAFLETVFDHFVEEIGASEDLAATALLRFTIAHIGPYDLTTDMVLLHLFLHEVHVVPGAVVGGRDAATIAEVAAHCHLLLNCSVNTELAPLVLLSLLHSLAGSSSSAAAGGDEDLPSLSLEVEQRMQPILQHNTAFRVWVSKRFTLEHAAAAAAKPLPAAPSTSAAALDTYLRRDMARELADAIADASLSTEAVRVSHLKAICSVLAAGDSSAIRTLAPYILRDTDFLLAPSSETLSTSSAPVAPQGAEDGPLGLFIELAAKSVMRAHVVPLLVDSAQRLYGRDQVKTKYPHGLKDFESITGHYFFRDDVPAFKGGSTPTANLLGMGELSGWLARDRIEAICDMLKELALGAVRGSKDEATGASSSYLAASDEIVSKFGKSMFHLLERFQATVSLPSKAFYSKIFLEPIALLAVIGSWTLRKNYDHGLARAISSELDTVVNFSIADGDFEFVRKIVFSYPDMALLRYVFDAIPVSLVATMGSSSPVFLQQPLHLSSVRIASMSFLETLSDREEMVKRGKIELTTVYVNFRNFTALGEQLHADGNRMLETYLANTAGQKKGLLDKEKETLKRQTKLLEEVESKFLQAAGLYIQDGLFERCLMCLRDLSVLAVQKKTTTKVLGLPTDQILSMLHSWEDAYDVVSLAYGYNIVSSEDWAEVVFRQVVVHGRKDFWHVLRALSICVMPDLYRRVTNLHRGEVPSTKEATARNANFQWLSGELQSSDHSAAVGTANRLSSKSSSGSR